jgi:hypothetical protein
MVTSHRRHNLRRAAATTLLAVSLFGAVAGSDTPVARAAAEFSTCSSNQLTVAIASHSGAYSAAGNQGIPFIIVNISKSTCALEGYPRLATYPAAYKHTKVKFTNGGGMIFIRVKPRVVIIAPGSTASFGVDYGDAYNQGDPNHGPCMTQLMTVYLPTRPHPYSQPFNTTENVNFCFAGFHFEVTAIQGGPIAKGASSEFAVENVTRE